MQHANDGNRFGVENVDQDVISHSPGAVPLRQIISTSTEFRESGEPPLRRLQPAHEPVSRVHVVSGYPSPNVVEIAFRRFEPL